MYLTPNFVSTTGVQPGLDLLSLKLGEELLRLSPGPVFEGGEPPFQIGGAEGEGLPAAERNQVRNVGKRPLPTSSTAWARQDSQALFAYLRTNSRSSPSCCCVSLGSCFTCPFRSNYTSDLVRFHSGMSILLLPPRGW